MAPSKVAITKLVPLLLVLSCLKPNKEHGLVMASEKIEKIGAEISSLTLEEARSLVDYLKYKLGVFGGAFGAAFREEEKMKFDVVIGGVPGGDMVAVIKAVRLLTNLPLKEAKDIVDNLPQKIKVGVSKDEAEEAKRLLEEVGAQVSIV